MSDGASEDSIVKIRGRKVRTDANGFVSLKDLQAAAGFTTNRTPAMWQRLEITKRAMLVMMERIMRDSHNKSKISVKSIIYSKVGRGGDTFAHPVLALSYAEFLNPTLGVEVREVFLRYKAADASLADDILQRAPRADNEWAGVRALGRAQRIDLTATLKNHEVTQPVEYAKVTNATYTGLTGKTAAELKRSKGLKKSANLRNAMSTKELVFVMAAEQLAQERIEDENSRGVVRCSSAAEKSASFIRRAIEADRADRIKKLA
jgi:KilA-N domain